MRGSRLEPGGSTLALGALAALACACATAEPMLVGGRTVPRGRTDLALGAAVRVPVGDLTLDPAASDAGRLLTFGAPSGAAPVAFVRHGVGDDLDLGLAVSGSSLRGSLRGQIALGSFAQLVLGIQPHVGLVHDGASSAVRGGGVLPIAIAIDVYSIYEAWIGVRVGLEHVSGDLAGRSVALTGLRTGGAVGLAVGFRSLQVMIELAVDHELWWGALGDARVELGGVSLTPAFALRLRL